MPKSGVTADDFTQFQLKEYENISQAHFKTNEVLATFYRYYLLITAIPITTIGLAILNFSSDGISQEGRILAYYLFGVSAVLLSVVGVAVISYIEGLRLGRNFIREGREFYQKIFFREVWHGTIRERLCSRPVQMCRHMVVSGRALSYIMLVPL